MTAFATDRALLTGFHSLKGDRWGVVLQVNELPSKTVMALKAIHLSEPVMLCVVPHDAADMFKQRGYECKREKMTESRWNKLAVQRLWIALGCPGTLDEFYAERSAQWRAALEREAADIGGLL